MNSPPPWKIIWRCPAPHYRKYLEMSALLEKNLGCPFPPRGKYLGMFPPLENIWILSPPLGKYLVMSLPPWNYLEIPFPKRVGTIRFQLLPPPLLGNFMFVISLIENCILERRKKKLFSCAVNPECFQSIPQFWGDPSTVSLSIPFLLMKANKIFIWDYGIFPGQCKDEMGGGGCSSLDTYLI